MKQIRKQLAALLLAVALAAACAAPAFAAATAASIELTRKGSITVTLRDSESGSAVSGGKLTLYQVASISRQNGNLSYDYTNGFENCGVSLGDLSESDLARPWTTSARPTAKGRRSPWTPMARPSSHGCRWACISSSRAPLPPGMRRSTRSWCRCRWWRRTRTSTMWTLCPRWAR